MGARVKRKGRIFRRQGATDAKVREVTRGGRSERRKDVRREGTRGCPVRRRDDDVTVGVGAC